MISFEEDSRKRKLSGKIFLGIFIISASIGMFVSVFGSKKVTDDYKQPPSQIETSTSNPISTETPVGYAEQNTVDTSHDEYSVIVTDKKEKQTKERQLYSNLTYRLQNRLNNILYDDMSDSVYISIKSIDVAGGKVAVKLMYEDICSVLDGINGLINGEIQINVVYKTQTSGETNDKVISASYNGAEIVGKEFKQETIRYMAEEWLQSDTITELYK